MSGFIANGPVPSGHINSDPFWPTIELEHVRANLRIDSSVDPARLEVAVIAAVISVNRELRAWRLERARPAMPNSPKCRPTRCGTPPNWCSCICAQCSRLPPPKWPSATAGTTPPPTATTRPEDIATTIDDYRRDQRWAIRDFLKRPRTTVELI